MKKKFLIFKFYSTWNNEGFLNGLNNLAWIIYLRFRLFSTLYLIVFMTYFDIIFLGCLSYMSKSIALIGIVTVKGKPIEKI